MKKGGGKAKGSAFERKICKALSLWVSHGEKEDLFWRSAMSGGRSTVAHKKGVDVRQAGDICAVAPEAHKLTDDWYIECKCVRDMGLVSWMLSNKGPIAKWWKEARKNAARHEREPMLIVKQNNGPVLVIVQSRAIEMWTEPQINVCSRNCDVALFSDMILGSF